MSKKKDHYPFMFNFREAITGSGFLAGVTISGRSLMLEEDGGWWMYGVRPGAIAETGATPQETFLRFIERLRTVLHDFATDASDYPAFRVEVESFFYQPDEEEEVRWEAARKSLRESQAKLKSWDLPKEAPESRPAGVSVVRLDKKSSKRFTPADNLRYEPIMAA